MAESPGEDVLVVPPIPLATGQVLEPEDDGPPVRITKVEVVVSTEDGNELRIPLVQPSRRLVGALTGHPLPPRGPPPVERHPRITLPPRGETRVRRPPLPPRTRRYVVRRLHHTPRWSRHTTKRRGTPLCLHLAPPGDPRMGPRETQALLQRLLAARPELTPEQAARLVAAAAARSSAGTPGARRPAAKRPTNRRPASRTRAKQRTATEDRTSSRWSTRLGVVAMSTLLLPAAAVLALPGADDPDRPGGPVDVTEVALSTQTSLLAQADRYRALEQQITERRADLAEARDVVATVEAQVAAQQQILGASAADLYRSVPSQRYPLLGLSVHDPAATDAALYGQAVVERDDLDREGAAVRAQRTVLALEQARRQAAAAEADVAEALEQADGVLRLVRDEVEELSPAVTGQIAGLGAIPVPGAQQERNETAMRRWQAYLARLAAAGIEPPPAARLADAAHLPAGFSPALDEYARPIPGIAWAVIGNSPVTVLPAETVAAVSTALSQLGKPFVPDGRGPDSYDCGGFTSASWLLAGHAIPATPEEQWAGGAPVALTDLQIGDLVFSADGLDVGLYLGDGDVIGASAGTYQVGVRDLAAGSSAVRVTLHAPAQPNEALRGAGTTGPCGAPPPSPERVATPGLGWLGQRPDPGRGAVRDRRGRARAALRRGCLLPAAEHGLPGRVRDADVHHRLLPLARRTGRGVLRQAGAGRGAGHVQPRVGPGGGPVRWHQRRRDPAVDLDDPERGSLRVRAAHLGGTGRREARAVALGVRLHP